jgi:hypothetical protein
LGAAGQGARRRAQRPPLPGRRRHDPKSILQAGENDILSPNPAPIRRPTRGALDCRVRQVACAALRRAQPAVTDYQHASGCRNHRRSPAHRRRRKTQTVLPRPPGTVGIAYAIATDSTDRRHALGAGVEGAAGCTSTSRAPLELLRTRRRGTAAAIARAAHATRAFIGNTPFGILGTFYFDCGFEIH